jgi:hypothetical protein
MTFLRSGVFISVTVEARGEPLSYYRGSKTLCFFDGEGLRRRENGTGGSEKRES